MDLRPLGMLHAWKQAYPNVNYADSLLDVFKARTMTVSGEFVFPWDLATENRIEKRSERH